jgi:transposase
MLRAQKRGDEGGPEQESLGRSRGGFSTKVHVSVSGLGLPVEFRLTPGQRADVAQAEPLLDGYSPAAVIADKAYDSDGLVKPIETKGAEAVIPPKVNRKQPRDFDRYLDKVRNLVERFINRITQYRRVATRYEKAGRNFLAFIQVASHMVLLQ